MYSMMQDVITRGTGTRAKVLKRKDLAGKTGTTNDQRDAWFNGYNQSIVAISWVGFDNNSKLGNGEFGGRAALPGWIHFMRKALEFYPNDNPPGMPDGMLSIRIDPKTGKLAAINQADAIFEVFRTENAPVERAQQEQAVFVPSSDNASNNVPVEDSELF
jgi:penicillin-binding protein 1A